MSPKRLDRAAPPSVGDEWQVRFGTGEAADGWEELCRHVAANTREAFELMRSNPRPPQDSRHMRLRGKLSEREFAGKQLEQWQIEVTGGARIWYLPDDEKRTVWVVLAGVAHPKATQRRSGRR